MTNQSKLDTFDNVVVLLLENRLFDSSLGYSFEDSVLTGNSCLCLEKKLFKIPMPSMAKGYYQHKFIELYQGG